MTSKVLKNVGSYIFINVCVCIIYYGQFKTNIISVPTDKQINCDKLYYV